LGLASLLGVVIVCLPPPEVTRRLRDGSEVTLEGVTYGKTAFHLIQAGGLTERFLRLSPLPRVRVVEFTARPSRIGAPPRALGRS